ncbi:MAG TPA: energy-coupled thiamine transporter ThiT [Bacillales bacterium]|nr:energy-coupled thiamine transporter ThiT [Bacillales bacterium]
MTRNVRFITDTAVMVAVAAILGFLKFDAPWAYGGSVSIEMLPIVLMAFRYGLKGGLITGFIYGFVDFLIEPVFAHPIQMLLDYPVAFMLVGFAGLVKPKPDSSKRRIGTTIVIGTLIGTGCRFVSHFVSGIVWWGQYAPEGTPVWIYSLVYNAGYLIPSFVLTAVVMVLLVADTPRLLKMESVQKV